MYILIIKHKHLKNYRKLVHWKCTKLHTQSTLHLCIATIYFQRKKSGLLVSLEQKKRSVAVVANGLGSESEHIVLSEDDEIRPVGRKAMKKQMQASKSDAIAMVEARKSIVEGQKKRAALLKEGLELAKKQAAITEKQFLFNIMTKETSEISNPLNREWVEKMQKRIREGNSDPIVHVVLDEEPLVENEEVSEADLEG